jgi:hypothetical protein
MSEPKPPPPADPKKEGGVKTPPQTSPAPEETGMIDEGDPSLRPRDERPGGMIGEG